MVVKKQECPIKIPARGYKLPLHDGNIFVRRFHHLDDLVNIPLKKIQKILCKLLRNTIIVDKDIRFYTHISPFVGLTFSFLL
jgi:hypothetical protein